MPRRVDADIRGDEDIVAYGDFRLIQYGEVEVREEIFPYLDIRAVVAVERLDEREILSCLSKQLFQQCPSGGLIGRI